MYVAPSTSTVSGSALNCRSSDGGRDPGLVEVVGPQHQLVGPRGHQPERLDRVGHVVEHAAGHQHVEALLGLLEVGHEVAADEVRATQVEELLDHEALEERPRVGLHREDLGPGGVEHRGVPALERAELEHPPAGQVAAEPGDRRVDPGVVEERGLAGRHAEVRRERRGPLAREDVDRGLRRRGPGRVGVERGRSVRPPWRWPWPLRRRRAADAREPRARGPGPPPRRPPGAVTVVAATSDGR